MLQSKICKPVTAEVTRKIKGLHQEPKRGTRNRTQVRQHISHTDAHRYPTTNQTLPPTPTLPTPPTPPTATYPTATCPIPPDLPASGGESTPTASGARSRTATCSSKLRPWGRSDTTCRQRWLQETKIRWTNAGPLFWFRMRANISLFGFYRRFPTVDGCEIHVAPL